MSDLSGDSGVICDETFQSNESDLNVDTHSELLHVNQFHNTNTSRTMADLQLEEMRRLNTRLDKEKDNILQKAEENLRYAASATNSTTASSQRRGYRTASKAMPVGPTSSSSLPHTPVKCSPSSHPSSLASWEKKISQQSQEDSLTTLREAEVMQVRIIALEQQLQQLIVQVQAGETSIHTLQEEKRNMATELTKLTDTVNSLSAKLQQEKALHEELKLKTTELISTNEKLTASISTAQKEQKNTDKSNQDVTLRLQRAQKEVETVKTNLLEKQSEISHQWEESKQSVERLTTENRRLKQQKVELLSAFRKQNKLIDVLKRQKMHIEAARLLAFTEEEFTKSLELGEIER